VPTSKKKILRAVQCIFVWQLTVSACMSLALLAVAQVVSSNLVCDFLPYN